MFGIPEWALGIAVILIALTVARVVRGALRGVGAAGRALVGDSSSAELTRQREALEEVQRRLSEIEERLDFAERLLAQKRDAERLAPPPR